VEWSNACASKPRRVARERSGSSSASSPRSPTRAGRMNSRVKAEPPQTWEVVPQGLRDQRSVRSGVAEALAVSAFASLARFEANAVTLRQAIERAPMDAKELRGKLFVPARLFQDAAHVRADDVLETEGSAPSGFRGRGVEQARRQIFGDELGLRAQRRRPLD